MFSMFKGETRTLTGNATTVEFQRGTFKVRPHRKAIAARFKVRMNLTKSTSDAALTAAEVRTFLAGFDLTMSYGASQQHVPFSKLDWQKLRALCNYGLGSEWEGADDSSTGLIRTIASTATAVTFHIRVPFTALGWQDQEFTQFWGIGHTQAKTVVFELRQNAPSLPSGFAISGNVTIDMLGPDEVPARFDTWSYVPVYRELAETNRVADRLSSGLPALIFERTAVHASTTMTGDCRLSIRDTLLYEVPLSDVIARYRDPQAYFPSNADLSTLYTLLWAIPPGVKVPELPTGKPVFEQVTQQLSTMAISEWTYQQVAQGTLESDMQEAAVLTGRRISAISAFQVDKRDFPKTFQFCSPIYLVKDGDKEFDGYAGLLAGPETTVVIPNVPPTLGGRVRGAVMERQSNKEFAAAEDAIQQLTLSVPGAGTPEGLKSGSRVLDKMRTNIGQ